MKIQNPSSGILFATLLLLINSILLTLTQQPLGRGLLPAAIVLAIDLRAIQVLVVQVAGDHRGVVQLEPADRLQVLFRQLV